MHGKRNTEMFETGVIQLVSGDNSSSISLMHFCFVLFSLSVIILSVSFLQVFARLFLFTINLINVLPTDVSVAEITMTATRSNSKSNMYSAFVDRLTGRQMIRLKSRVKYLVSC